MAGQDPDKITASLQQFLAERVPPDCKVEFVPFHGNAAISFDPNAPYVQAADYLETLLDILALLFVTLRVIYITMYVAGLPSVRSAVWLAALVVNIGILFIGWR